MGRDSHIVLESSQSATELPCVLPDETLSSWCLRARVKEHLRGPSRWWGSDPDFGVVEVPRSLERFEKILLHAAIAPCPRVIPACWRTLICPHCLIGDASEGIPFYRRRAWAIGWRTTCAKHGQQLHDLDVRYTLSSLASLLASRRYGRRCASVHFMLRRARTGQRTGYWFRCEPRAGCLEAALDADPAESVDWRPLGYTAVQLERLYWSLAFSLCRQFQSYFDGGLTKRFLRAPNACRHMVNVCAEAVIARWTSSPLPRSNSAHRTDVIAQMAGYVPHARIPERAGPFHPVGLPGVRIWSVASGA